MRYYIIAGEASGDLHASHLIAALKAEDPAAEFRGFGGDLMQAEGMTLVRHYRELAYMGFVAVILHARTILQGLQQCKDDIKQWQPDVVILVDYPGFNLKIAKYVHSIGLCPVYYYIAPKLWAWKEYRIKVLKRDVGELFSILPFEVDFFEKKHGYTIHYVGNPTMDEVAAYKAVAAQTTLQQPYIALLAGSRLQEIRDNLPRMMEAAAPFTDRYRLVIAAAPGITDTTYQQYIGVAERRAGRKIPVQIVKNRTYDVLSQATAALVTSGTATLETALFQVPQVVCYFMQARQLATLGRRLFIKIPFISLVNLVAGREVVPELVADQMTVARCRQHLASILPGGAARDAQLRDYEDVATRLGTPGAPQRAAHEILCCLQRQQTISRNSHPRNSHHFIMKTKHLLAAGCLAVLLAACGSSRHASRHASLPDNATAALDRERTGSKTTSVREREEREAREAARPRVVGRIDSLLLSADTLLQVSQLGLHVVDLTSGQTLYARDERQRLRPASTEKVVTAITALGALGPSYCLTTRLLATAPVSGGTLQGDLYLRGVMDPLLSMADVRSLAAQLKSAGIRRITGRLIADTSFKDGDEYGWGWCWDDDNPTLSPLLYGGKPGLAAAVRNALSKAGITLGKGTATGTTPAAARTLASISRPLTEVLLPMMKDSDNLCAEAVFYQMGATRKQITPIIHGIIGTESVVADGSGLSLYNYQTPATFTRLLTYAAARPDSILTPLMTALPIAAVDGTLKKRMAGTAAAANVRAKTGSVSAVSTLVGYTTQRSTGHLIAFAIMNQGVRRMAEGRALQDQLCVLLSE